jgi:hypothetical protein
MVGKNISTIQLYSGDRAVGLPLQCSALLVVPKLKPGNDVIGVNNGTAVHVHRRDEQRRSPPLCVYLPVGSSDGVDARMARLDFMAINVL